MTAHTGLGTTTANNLLNVFRHNSYDVVAVYGLLHTGQPGADAEDHVSVGDATLKLVNFSAPSGGSLALSSGPTWTNGGTSETLSHLSLWDGPTGPGTNTPLWSVALTSPQAWISADTWTLDACGLVLTPIMSD